jgi:hypothetical protein
MVKKKVRTKKVRDDEGKSLGEAPSKPGRKRPSERGVGKANSRRLPV